MNSIPFGTEADVFWSGGRRTFSDLTRAIRFVMEEVNADTRADAWIMTKDRSLTFELIEEAYGRLSLL